MRPELPFRVSFDRHVESQNKTTYSHWSKHFADKKDWLRRVQKAFADYHGMRLPWSSWALVRVYSSRRRLMDFANFVGGAKPLIDCLTECGVIYDDDPLHFTCSYQQVAGDTDITYLTLLEYKDECLTPDQLRELSRTD